MDLSLSQPPFDSKPTLFLHIGSEKTGTSSLHWFLSENAEQLNRQGFTYLAGDRPYYSKFSKAHSPLVASFFPEPPDFIAPSEYGSSESLLLQLKEDLLREKRNVILSSEHFSSRVRSVADLQDLAAALDSHEVYVIFYMRSQYELYQAAYSTAVINGRREPIEASHVHLGNPYYNYVALLSPWAQVFGRENIIVRNYKDLLDQDICADFARLVGLRDFFRFRKVPRKNQSLSANGAEVIRKLNRLLPAHRESGYPAYFASIQFRWFVNSLLRLFRPADSSNDQLLQSKIQSIFSRSNRELSEHYPNRIEPGVLSLRN